MLTHTVLFRLHRPVDAVVKERFLGAVRAFGENPPFGLGPATVELDAGLRPEEGRSTVEASMTVQFPDADAFASYLAHPAHVDLVEKVLAPSCESWLSIQVES